ncbi:MAG: hypothetical protein ACREP4_01210 [Stenotrophomonas sp.]|uniref:hypothetical protein n=1 Tax=Stenotrophomonas sp. TaxID=69392 RepID=UPI003D6CCCF2
MERLQTRGPEIGICNICGLTERLTDDHVPPKGVPLVGQVYLDRLSEALGAQKPTRQARLFQRGVKYRSICAKCNNERLGQALDPTLVQFCKDAKAAITERLYLPSDIRVQQNKLFRSVIGHLLAHGLGTHKAGQFIERKTEYFLKLDQPFPEDLRLYYWVYPYKPQIVGRALARKELIIGTDVVIFSLLKFFPIAWLCSIGDLEGPDAAQVTRVDHLATPNIEDFAHLRINPSYIPAAHWPEAPGGNSVVLHNRLGTIAIPRPPQ